MTNRIVRWAGLSALLGGLCYVFVGIFHPANVPSSVTTTRWEAVHVVACAMCFFGLLGLAGLYARQARKAGWLGLAGYVLLSLWLVMIMGFSFVEAFVLPHIASVAPGFVQSWMGMFNSPAGTSDIGALPTLWTLSAPALILGGLFFGWAGAFLAASTVLAPIAAVLPNASQPKAAIPMGIALVWLGYALWSEKRAEEPLGEDAGIVEAAPLPAV
jgi:hypothetical protein